jgi:hypothetical protein
MTEHYLSPARLEQERERVIGTLSAHFAHDNLDTAEFENRLDLAYRATSLAELTALLADLPVQADSPAAPRPSTALARPEDVRKRQFVVAVMSGSERRGVWSPARSIEVVAVMGGVQLDFREAVFAPGVTQVNVLAFWGGVEIMVPPEVRVECSGMGIMGGFEGLDQRGANHPDTPILRITGLAVMGGVEVAQRLRGESARDARRRLREERKRLRDQHAEGLKRLRDGD